MSNQIQSLLSKIQTIQTKDKNSTKKYTYEKLEWKYGTIIFTDQKPNEKFIETLQSNKQNHKLFLTTHPFQKSHQFPSLWLQSVEQNKSLDSVEKITQFLIQNNANRNSHLIIQGGGLLMDLGGFSASMYMRGLKNVTLIPTTFLGMVDATVGGKTAVNYSNTKNLLGTIRNPNQIIIHPHFLQTQTERQFFNGIVETIKMAITYDSNFFEFLEEVDFKTLRNSENSHILLDIIKRSLMIKIMVVQKDLTEQNERKWLNFGHTIAHGIQLDQKNTLLHGQCVAIGIIKALQIGLDKGIIAKKNIDILQRSKKLLKKLNLTCQIPDNVNVEKMIQRMLKDKKMSDASKSNVDFVLIEQIGKRCEKTTKISLKDLRKYLGNGVEIKYPIQKDLNFINNKFQFPSSKSISLRYLFISCLALYHTYCKGKSGLNKQRLNLPKIKISNFLTSEDTEKMIYSLKQLGFSFDFDSQKRQISIIGYYQKQFGVLDVGNSGITARFILPLCFLIKGKWTINCHKRMEERPNSQIFDLCSDQFQGNIRYLNQPLCFPVQINSTGKILQNKSLRVEGKQSSQFISSAIINWAFIDKRKQILFKSGQSNDQNIVSESYLHMTFKCLQTFGIKTSLNKQLKKIQINSQNIKIPQIIHVENDLSTFSYPYTFYELHGIKNQSIESSNYIQGDTLFYYYVGELKEKIKNNQKIAKFDFNNCTDTFMTFLVYCCADSILSSGIQKIVIENISNQRVKESNRIDLTIKNLKKIGIQVEEYENSVSLVAKPLTESKFQSKYQIIFETHEDHRLAMSFGILSTLLSKKFPNIKFIIDSKKAVEKTFPQFWKYLNESGVDLNFISVQDLRQKQLNFAQKQTKFTNSNLNQDIIKNSLFIIGNRGSGKTTIGRNISGEMKLGFLDLDDLINEQIKSKFNLPSIQQMIERQGWDQFRNLQSEVLQKTLSSLRYSSNLPFVISTGGGILQRQLNRTAFKRQKVNLFYLQRPFSQLKAFQSQHRPNLTDFQNLSKKRELVYEDIASQIITFPTWEKQDEQKRFTIESIKKFLGKQKQIKQGYILCLGEEILNFKQSLTDEELHEVQTFEIRIDKLLVKGLTLKEIRQIISKWRLQNMHKNLILTLRSKQELGQFQQNTQQNYQNMMKKISKIPCDFLDHQVKYQPTFVYNFNKLIHSYHGNDQNIVKKLINQPYGFKKYCFMRDNKIKTPNLFQFYNSSFKKGICIDLSNPLSRFNTKYQMIIPQKSFKAPTSTGIMTLNQMKSLKKILRLH